MAISPTCRCIGLQWRDKEARSLSVCWKCTFSSNLPCATKSLSRLKNTKNKKTYYKNLKTYYRYTYNTLLLIHYLRVRQRSHVMLLLLRNSHRITDWSWRRRCWEQGDGWWLRTSVTRLEFTQQYWISPKNW